MIWLFLLLVLGFFATESLSAVQQGENRKYNALKFGKTKNDYVLFKTKMDAIAESYSLCGWIKKMETGNSYGSYFWFAYSTPSSDEEIRAADNTVTSYSFYTLNKYINLQGKLTVKIGVWNHWCLTWNYSTKSAKAYYNGKEVGSTTTAAGRKVVTEGYVVLGQDFNGYGTSINYGFHGEMYKVNLFNKELSAAEVKTMADGGLCSHVEEGYGSNDRSLKWEDLIVKQRSGDVKDIDVGCLPEKKKCGCAEKEESSSRWALLRHEKYFKKKITSAMVDELKESWEMLRDFEGATVTDGFICHFICNCKAEGNTCN